MPADMTGGRTVLNTNTPQDALPSILDESQAYYLLGFPPSDSSSNRLHSIEVKVDRPGVHVRARSGYFGNEEAASAAAGSSRAPLARAVEGAVPRTDIPLSLVAVPFATPGKTTGTVALTLGVTSPAGGNAPRVEPVHLAIAALDPKGRVIASREASAQMSTGRSSGSPQQFDNPLAPGPGPWPLRNSRRRGTVQQGSAAVCSRSSTSRISRKRRSA